VATRRGKEGFHSDPPQKSHDRFITLARGRYSSPAETIKVAEMKRKSRKGGQNRAGRGRSPRERYIATLAGRGRKGSVRDKGGVDIEAVSIHDVVKHDQKAW